MPSSPYTLSEKSFLESYIDRWTLAGREKYKKGAIKPRTALISQIITDFFVKFPERDCFLQDATEKAFPEAVRLEMPQVRCMQS